MCLSHTVLSVTCTRCSREPFHWAALEAVPSSRAAWGAQGGAAPSIFLSCAPQHPLCPGEGDKTHLISAAFCSENFCSFVVALTTLSAYCLGGLEIVLGRWTLLGPAWPQARQKVDAGLHLSQGLALDRASPFLCAPP